MRARRSPSGRPWTPRCARTRNGGTSAARCPTGRPIARVDGVIITFTDITEIRRKADAEIKARSVLAESLEHQVEARVRALRVELFKLAITEERERRAFATDLHDELCQPLAAASLRLDRTAAGGRGRRGAAGRCGT